MTNGEPRHPDLIELLSPSLLDDRRSTIEATARLAASLRVHLGWHYLLDIAWTLREVPVVPGMQVLDAGAGIGLLQWQLAGQGVNVLSLDRLDRSRMSIRFRSRYRVQGLADGDLGSMAMSLARDVRRGTLAVDLGRHARTAISRLRGHAPPQGVVTVHRSGLEDLSIVPTGSVDAIVSISSLEHNDPSGLRRIVAELWRVLRPGGVLTATVGASRDRDWFHEPSKGWCLSESTIRRAFDVSADAVSNFDRFDEILEATRNSVELRRRLSRTYYRSGRNGMPWGRWDPKYLSVGIRRRKPE